MAVDNIGAVAESDQEVIAGRDRCQAIRSVAIGLIDPVGPALRWVLRHQRTKAPTSGAPAFSSVPSITDTAFVSIKSRRIGSPEVISTVSGKRSPDDPA